MNVTLILQSSLSSIRAALLRNGKCSHCFACLAGNCELSKTFCVDLVGNGLRIKSLFLIATRIFSGGDPSQYLCAMGRFLFRATIIFMARIVEDLFCCQREEIGQDPLEPVDEPAVRAIWAKVEEVEHLGSSIKMNLPVLLLQAERRKPAADETTLAEGQVEVRVSCNVKGELTGPSASNWRSLSLRREHYVRAETSD
jgi:hypothetical protein